MRGPGHPSVAPKCHQTGNQTQRILVNSRFIQWSTHYPLGDSNGHLPPTPPSFFSRVDCAQWACCDLAMRHWIIASIALTSTVALSQFVPESTTHAQHRPRNITPRRRGGAPTIVAVNSDGGVTETDPRRCAEACGRVLHTCDTRCLQAESGRSCQVLCARGQVACLQACPGDLIGHILDGGSPSQEPTGPVLRNMPGR
jgi:hypothetical protein